LAITESEAAVTRRRTALPEASMADHTTPLPDPPADPTRDPENDPFAPDHPEHPQEPPDGPPSKDPV
jgi:hypothetical protein